MTPRSESANFPLLISRERAANTLASALRLYVGRGRRYSVKQLSNATGVPDRQIECALCDPDSTDWRRMPFEAILSISMFLGAEFTADYLALAKQGAFDLPEDDLPPGAIAADNAEDNAVITRAALDGHFDEDEKPGLKVVGVRLVTRGAQVLKQARAA